MNPWISNAIFYHIYPLGLTGAPHRNDFNLAPVERLDQLYAWLDSIQALGANALYLGPLFESTAHGYDTADYFTLDRRLGSNETLARFSAEVHARGMRLILDGVFNHVGRDFWAFRDVQANGQDSAFCGWFADLRFDQRSPFGDPFSYAGWNGNYDLVKLNLGHPDVRNHLFAAVEMWVREFGIDGLRLDTADCLDFDFLRALSAFCHSLRPDFWLMGEVIHGDYRRWANPEMLASVTNYEVYKGLFSSHNDHNYFEVAYALNRQFGPGGLYREISLYSFADNHDVDRVASSLRDPRHLFPLYALLLTIPGVPSIYYGSEWGLAGRRDNGSDLGLRPTLVRADFPAHAPQPDLPAYLARLSAVRHASPALQRGDYQQVLVAAEQLAFAREADGERVLVCVNSAEQPAAPALRLPPGWSGRLRDLLSPSEVFAVENGICTLPLPAFGARVLRID